jgi:DNA-directed RNA polymerase subunit alpha
MLDSHIVLPSKPRIVKEEGMSGTFEIDGLYPGYGQTLGNSLRRIILSSLPGAAITSVKIKGADHEFTTISGVKEDVIAILLNLKKVRFQLLSTEPVLMRLKVKGIKDVKASDIDTPGQVKLLTPDLTVAHITDKNTELDMEFTVEQGLGYIPKEVHQKNRVDIGTISVDAIFTPIRRASYEVENMRVGDRTDFNRLRLFIETDGTLTPREALEKSITLMISQLKAIVGFKETDEGSRDSVSDMEEGHETKDKKEIDPESLKTRIESLGLSARTMNALVNANIRTVGGLSRKREEDLLEIEGLGAKGINEIKKALEQLGIFLK